VFSSKREGHSALFGSSRGDSHELSNGHAFFAAPPGGRHADVRGAQVLATDPDVTQAAAGADCSPESGTLHALDIAIGNAPPSHAGFVRRRRWLSNTPTPAMTKTRFERRSPTCRTPARGICGWFDLPVRPSRKGTSPASGCDSHPRVSS
jgi:hypothetical protein